MKYFIPFFLVGILIILYGAFFKSHKCWKLMGIKKKVYNHPASITILIILIAVIIAIIFGK